METQKAREEGAKEKSGGFKFNTGHSVYDAKIIYK